MQKPAYSIKKGRQKGDSYSHPQPYVYPPYAYVAYSYPQYPYQPYRSPIIRRNSDKIGRYEIVFHWNRLDWNFPDSRMKQEFEERQYWKKAMPAGIKVDQQGNFYVSVPRWAQGIPSTMNRIVIKNGKPLLEAFPNWEWNQAGNPKALQSVLGYEIDEHNRMWLLDQGKIAYAPSQEGSQKLVIWDLTTNKWIDSIPIPNEIASYRTSFLNDLVVDNKHGFVYITDSGNGEGWTGRVAGGIIVYNMKTKTLRRVLDRHYSTQDFPDFVFEIDYKPIFKDRPLKLGADGIALSADRSTLYYCPVTGRNLYAIDTVLLRNFHTPLKKINKAVQSIGSKGTTTDGMHADNKGNVFYTMLEGKGIGIYISKRNQFSRFVSDDRMLWVDGVAFDQKGFIIFNSNRLHQMFGNEEEINWDYPYNLIVWKAFVGKDVKSYLYA